MTALAADALQVAIFDALEASAALTAMGAEIYDEPDADAAFPYVSLGNTTFTSNENKTTDGVQVEYEVNAWSARESQMEAKAMVQHIDAALHRAGLSLDGFKLLENRRVRGSIFRQTVDNKPYYRGFLQFVATIYEE